MPLVLLGSVLGGWVVDRLSQRAFDLLAVGMPLVAAGALLIPHG